MAVLRLTRILLRVAVSLALLLAILWSAAALWIDGPASRSLAGALAGGVVLTAGLMAVLIRPFWQAAAVILVSFLAVLGWWLTLSPSNDRDWQPDVARLPMATIDGSRLTVRNALTENCTTTIWHHAKAVGSDFPLDWRLLANGYLVDLSCELGTVNTSIGLGELKRRSDITAREAGDGVGFSRAIREGLPSRPEADRQLATPG